MHSDSGPAPFIIDTDVDIDDWMAMLYLLNHPSVEVRGVTVVGTGACHLEPGTQNALNILMLPDKGDIPVAMGLSKPMKYNHQFPPDIRKPVDELYGIRLPRKYHNPRRPLPDAIEFLYAVLTESEEKINILAIGPLTNLGTLLIQFPELAEKIAGIYIMGGTIEAPGNVHAADPSIPNLVSEWNIYLDPVAADIVFKSGAPVHLIPLDATSFVPVTKAFYLRIMQNHKTPSAAFVYNALIKDFGFLRTGSFYFWDPLAAVVGTNPHIGAHEVMNIRIDTRNNDRSGQLLLDDEKGSPINVYLNADGPAFDDLLLNVLNGEKTYKSAITFILDGKQVTLHDVDPRTRLIDYLHSQDVNKTGTKLVCGEGGCGACTVMLTQYDHNRKALQKKAVNSCLRPLCQLDGAVVNTTQGIGSVKQALDQTQYTVAANNGSQCGYCTPGFVMNMYALLQNNPKPTMKEVEDVFDGNICRCTGYRPILEGFKKLACDYKPPGHVGEIVIDPNYKAPVKPYEPNNPPQNFIGYMANPQPISLQQGNFNYFRPTQLSDVLALKKQYNGGPGTFKLLSGNTDTGIVYRRPVYSEKPLNPQYLVDVTAIPELSREDIGPDGLHVGGGVSISGLIQLLNRAIEKEKKYKTRGLVVLKEHLEVVANHQIRNVGSLAGNLYMAVNMGFLSDLMVVLSCLGATIELYSNSGVKTYEVLKLPVEDQLPKETLYGAIHIPFTQRDEYADSFKIRSRNEDSHAIVNCAYRVKFDENRRVEEAHIVYNGLNASYGAENAPYGVIPFHAVEMPKTQRILKGRAWDEETLAKALNCLEQEVEAYCPPNGKGGKPLEIDQVPWRYRQSLALNLFYKFFVNLALIVNPDEVGDHVKSAGEKYQRPVSYGEQYYNSYPDDLPVSAPFVKLSAFMQASGEAKFSHDMEQPPDTLEAAFVYSLFPRGTFYYQLPVTTAWGRKGKRVTSDELKAFLNDWFKPFVDYACYSDIAAENRMGNWVGFGGDDPVFVPSMDDEIPKEKLSEAREGFHPGEFTCIGAPLGLVLANTREAALDIAAFVRNQCIVYQKKNAVLSMDEAIRKKQFFVQDPATAGFVTHIPEITRPGSNKQWLRKPGSPLKDSEGNIYPVVSGRHRTGAQNHFYLETMATLAVPEENKGVTLYTSTQTLADNQSVAAGVLGLSINDVQVVLRRDGGAYGGKQTRSRFNSTAAAIAAVKTNRPIRLVLDRHTNFVMCGNRHPFEGQYHLAYDTDGTIKGASYQLYSDGGNTYDVSFPVMDLALLNGDNVYQIDTFQTKGKVCRTNLISNTAFRSFGTVQSINISEEAIERVAHELGMLPEDVREKNLYQDGNYHWKGFQITDQTLATLKAYGFKDVTLKRLSKLKGVKYDNKKDFEAAVNSVSPEFDATENMLMLEEYSNTSYNFTPYLQGLKYCDIHRVWKGLKKSSEFEKRLKAVQKFNKENRWRKRGICMIPHKYGISYTGPRGTLNQGGAYIIAYQTDGSVLVQHGGVESGQGIQTKMAQIAAETLDIPITYIKMGDTSTAVVPDASPTAASTGSDLNGGAVAQACQALRERLERFCEDLEQYTVYFSKFDPTTMDEETNRQMQVVVNNWRERWSECWPMIVSLAYANRIDLTSGARYKTPHYSAVDLAHPFGSPFFYFTYSAACSEVELDVLTGEFTLLRTDILYDTGKSLNPLIDVGQLEGAFIQGVGNLTTEEMIYQGDNQAPREGYPNGAMVSFGTWDYKPPGSKNIPLNFQVGLVNNEGCKLIHKGPRLDAAAVKSSKGIGEPPLVLANTVFFAIKRAILASLQDQGKKHWVAMNAPATISRIQLACETSKDQLTLK